MNKSFVLFKIVNMYQNKKIALSLLYCLWKKNNQEYVQNTHEINKNRVDSYCYTMLLIKFVSVLVHSREI